MPDYLQIMKAEPRGVMPRKRRVPLRTTRSPKGWINDPRQGGGDPNFFAEGGEATVAGYPSQPFIYSSGATQPPSY